MAIKYKKKKFMREFAKERFGIAVPALADCHYKFYRGMEWLEFISNDFDHVKLVFNGSYARLIVQVVDDDGELLKVRDEIVRDI